MERLGAYQARGTAPGELDLQVALCRCASEGAGEGLRAARQRLTGELLRLLEFAWSDAAPEGPFTQQAAWIMAGVLKNPAARYEAFAPFDCQTLSRSYLTGNGLSLGKLDHPNLRTLIVETGGLPTNVIEEVGAFRLPVLAQLEVLDLSMGTLGNEGAEALLENPAIRGLRLLDIHHHYVSPGLVEKLRGAGIEVDASEPLEDNDEDEGCRYVAVSE